MVHRTSCLHCRAIRWGGNTRLRGVCRPLLLCWSRSRGPLLNTHPNFLRNRLMTECRCSSQVLSLSLYGFVSRGTQIIGQSTQSWLCNRYSIIHHLGLWFMPPCSKKAQHHRTHSLLAIILIFENSMIQLLFFLGQADGDSKHLPLSSNPNPNWMTG